MSEPVRPWPYLAEDIREVTHNVHPMWAGGVPDPWFQRYTRFPLTRAAGVTPDINPLLPQARRLASSASLSDLDYARNNTPTTMSSSSQHARKWSTMPIDTNAAPFLSLDFEDEVVYEDERRQSIKQGTICGLVEQLTRHDRLDVSFNETFLMTYPTFVCGRELFEILLQRLNMPPPPGLTDSDLSRWTEQKQKTVRFRVINILKTWLERYWMEPPTESTMDFLRHIHAQIQPLTNVPTCSQLLTIIEHRLKGQDILKRYMTPPNSTVPKPLTPRNMKKLKFLDLDPMELARQLTIIESRLFARIKPTECLNKSWQKKDTDRPPSVPASRRTSTSTTSSTSSIERTTGVNATILHSNQLANWVGEMILAQDEMKKRVSLIKQIVNIADNCRSLSNFATMMSLISGLATSPIYRLHRTWTQVNPKTRKLLEDMQSLMSSEKNFIKYRDKLHGASPPCIPFLGTYLTDLTFIEDGIPSHTPPPNVMINFSKRVKVAEILREIESCQAVGYSLLPVPEIQEFIVRNVQAAGGDVEGMYERSLALEPRMARSSR
ncbi:ras GEF [Aspergillus niger ATCC 13496]|uniref:Ras GEF n=1 Tax=Aspergillus niger ATCC 13496 TaxID=1353008 RepID=A0A370BZ44_ASPNG|nr:ras GEF [Aspergillus niger ATCC 13496]